MQTHMHNLFFPGSVEPSWLSHPQDPRIFHSSSTEGNASLEADPRVSRMRPGVPSAQGWAPLYAAELERESRQFTARKKLWSPRAPSDEA